MTFEILYLDLDGGLPSTDKVQDLVRIIVVDPTVNEGNTMLGAVRPQLTYIADIVPLTTTIVELHIYEAGVIVTTPLHVLDVDQG